MPITFDAITLGAEILSAGRTVTEADIVNFAGLSGDFNPLHTDEQWVVENTAYKGRIAHGLLVQSIGEGLAVEGISNWLILGFLEVQRRMRAPVYPGDRICQHYRVAEKRPARKTQSVASSKSPSKFATNTARSCKTATTAI